MAEVLCVYRQVQVLKRTAARSKKPGKSVAIVSYDEKPGIRAIATTAPDLPPVPGVHATFARDHEYKRHGILSLLAGIDLLTGKVHALVKERHRSREFIEFLKLLDAAYPAGTAIKLILDNHSAHISRETRIWLAAQPARPLRVYLHAQARILAQSRRGLLLQVRPFGPAPHPGHLKARAQGAYHGRHRGRQSPSRHPQAPAIVRPLRPPQLLEIAILRFGVIARELAMPSKVRPLFAASAGPGALGGFVQHVFRITGALAAARFEASVPRRQSKNALYYADFQIMPTSVGERAFVAVTAAYNVGIIQSSVYISDR
jgi:hypothetical protein